MRRGAFKDYIRPYFQEELRKSTLAKQRGDYVSCWNHLERAHILSQRSALLHLTAHWEMLLVAFKQKQAKEIMAQIFRLVVAAPGSWTGRFPMGNVGSSRVGAFRAMDLPDDLREILGRTGIE